MLEVLELQSEPTGWNQRRSSSVKLMFLLFVDNPALFRKAWNYTARLHFFSFLWELWLETNSLPLNLTFFIEAKHTEGNIQKHNYKYSSIQYY